MLHKSLSAAALKYIALVSMLIDHTAEVFYTASVRAGAPLFSRSTYVVLRGLGRLAFPIYAFLLAEGYFHTRSRGRYLLRLGLFALLSEPVFDRALFCSALEWKYQNVYFTLFFGLLAIWLFERATQEDIEHCGALRTALGLAGLAGMAAAARFCRTDYGDLGVLLVTVMAALREQPFPRDLASTVILYLMHPIELCACADFPLFGLYNGQRGRQNKLLFYSFYPVHLLLLSLLRSWLYGS